MKKTVIGILIISIFCTFFASCGKKEISDGMYPAEVTLEGGSGKSTIEKATVEIKNGKALATIVWSSPFYEYMMLEDVKYEPIQKEGNSTFKIPVILDEKIEVSASTVAMSQPYLIDYTLSFRIKGE